MCEYRTHRGLDGASLNGHRASSTNLGEFGCFEWPFFFVSAPHTRSRIASFSACGRVCGGRAGYCAPTGCACAPCQPRASAAGAGPHRPCADRIVPQTLHRRHARSTLSGHSVQLLGGPVGPLLKRRVRDTSWGVQLQKASGIRANRRSWPLGCLFLRFFWPFGGGVQGSLRRGEVGRHGAFPPSGDCSLSRRPETATGGVAAPGPHGVRQGRVPRGRARFLLLTAAPRDHQPPPTAHI